MLATNYAVNNDARANLEAVSTDTPVVPNPAADVREVVLCKDCSNHGQCITEDTFNLLRIKDPFCCVGGADRREVDDGT